MSKKKREQPTTIPGHRFKRVGQRINALRAIWFQRWPDGINPERCTHPLVRDIGPVARAFNGGVREASLYARMCEIEKFLSLPGF